MKTTICSLTLIAVFFCAYAQTNYLRPDAPPKIHIRDVTVPKNLHEPLQVTFELKATGRTPVALDQKLISFEIHQMKADAVYGWLLFSNTLPKVIVVQPKSNLSLTAMIVSNGPRSWSAGLHAGKCSLELGSGSEKWRYFDYQWMGPSIPDRIEFEIR